MGEQRKTEEAGRTQHCPHSLTLEMQKETVPPGQHQRSLTYVFASMWWCVRRTLILPGYSTFNTARSFSKKTQWDTVKLEEDINVL